MFDADGRLLDLNGQATRWRKIQDYPTGTLRFFVLEDQHPDIKAPMVRRATGITIYCPPSLQQYQIEMLKRRFTETAKALGASFSSLPEPLEFLVTNNTLDHHLPAQTKALWPLLIMSPNPGVEAKPLPPKHFTGQAVIGALKTLVSSLSSPLLELHADGKVLRQMSLPTLRWYAPNRRYIIGEPYSIASMGPAQYKSDIPFISLEPRYSAPECFEAKGTLTPATDVYALAKTMLAVLGIQWQSADPFPQNVTPYLDTVQRRYGFMFPDHILRFFKLSLHLSPAHRFQSLTEAINMFNNKAGQTIATDVEGEILSYDHNTKRGEIKNIQDGKWSFNSSHVTSGDKNYLRNGTKILFDVEKSVNNHENVRNIRILAAPVLERYSGTLKSYNWEKKYGFIDCPSLGEKNIHFSISAVRQGVRLRMQKGTAMEFTLGKNRRGDTAIDIIPLDRRF